MINCFFFLFTLIASIRHHPFPLLLSWYIIKILPHVGSQAKRQTLNGSQGKGGDPNKNKDQKRTDTIKEMKRWNKTKIRIGLDIYIYLYIWQAFISLLYYKAEILSLLNGCAGQSFWAFQFSSEERFSHCNLLVTKKERGS